MDFLEFLDFLVVFLSKFSGPGGHAQATRFGNVFGVELLLELRADPHHANTRGGCLAT